MEKVLYEASFTSSIVKCAVCMAIPILLTFGKFFMKQYYKILNLDNGAYTPSEKSKTPIYAIVFMWIFGLAILGNTIGEYNEVYLEYKNKRYLITEGYVENWDIHKGKNTMEKFEVNGIQFAYGEDRASIGYSKPFKKDSVIANNKHYMKIGYITLDDKNIIVYIAEIEPPPN